MWKNVPVLQGPSGDSGPAGIAGPAGPRVSSFLLCKIYIAWS